MKSSFQKKSFAITVITFTTLLGSIIFLGIYIFIAQRNHLLNFAKEQLVTVADLKVRQIVVRREERINDGLNLYNNISFIDDIKRWQNNKSDNSLKNRITHYLVNFRQLIYKNYYLLDSNLVIINSDNTDFSPIDSTTKENLAIARKEKRVLLSDLYFNQNSRQVELDLITPLFIENKFIGFIILKVDPYRKLFPIIKEWPTPSKSAETLLAKRVDSMVVFINELRLIHNVPFQLQISLKDTNVLAVKGFLGQDGVVEGIDYRMVPVVGAVIRVPETEWLVVAKMDKSEILTPVYQRAALIFGAVLLLVVFGVFIMYFQWKSHQRKQQAELLELDLQRLKTERELQESEQKFQAMFQNMNEGAVLHQLIFDENHNPIDYKLMSLNPAFERHTGINVLSATGAIGSELYGLIPPPYFDVYSHVALTGIPCSFETYYPPLEKHFQISVFSPKKDWFTTIFTDITDSKNATAKLRESEELFSSLARLSPVGLLRSDMNGTVTYWNEKLRHITGRSEEEVIGKGYLTSVFEDDIERVENAWNDFVKTGNSLSLQFRFKHADGSLIWVIGQAEIITRRDIKEVLYTITDITSMKKIESELKNSLVLLEQSNKELEQFAYVASHDLQEPLRMVSSYTQLLAKKYKDSIDGDGATYINFAVDGAQRMQMLINDLLDYSRITRQEHALELVSTSRVLGLVISNLRKKIEESGAIVTNDLMPQVMGNEQQLIRVFQNLIDNAIKYRSDTTPMVHISAREMESDYCFSITDNGIGIGEEYKERVFEIFERLHSASAYPGTGIGLAICKKVIEKLNGKIWLESNPVKGVTFYFTLKKGNK